MGSSEDVGIYAELAVGLGETLASANQPGLPYKISTSSKSDVEGGVQVTIGSFANYSKAIDRYLEITETHFNNPD